MNRFIHIVKELQILLCKDFPPPRDPIDSPVGSAYRDGSKSTKYVNLEISPKSLSEFSELFYSALGGPANGCGSTSYTFR